MSIERNVYPQIQPYQTRIMCLHANDAAVNSPLMCTLYIADLLHTGFRGLGLRSTAGDAIVEYNALSYAWGSHDKPKVISCNGVLLPISTNLFEALGALRDYEGKDQYLWVDAICINQADPDEVGKQVSNMFLIYGKAKEVVAWIGPASECITDVQDALVATQAFDVQPCTGLSDSQGVQRGLSYIYNRPYFGRLWIQQEVYATQTLKLQCGHCRFNWSDLLAKPIRLGKQSISPDLSYLSYRQTYPHLPRHIVSCLVCFDDCSNRNSSRNLDFIGTLLKTAILGATNPKDYIFGILGMTKTSAKAMSIQDWTIARRGELFIPIDYKAGLVSILSAVTWFVLMKADLTILAKFKAFGAGLDVASSCAMPSWVIDWRLAGRTFTNDRSHSELNNATLAELDQPGYDSLDTGVDDGDIAARDQFRDDNTDNAVCHRKLVVRGFVDSRFSVADSCVRCSSPGNSTWELGFESQSGDLIVSLANFETFTSFQARARCLDIDDLHFSNLQNTGVWLLRPATLGSDEEFKLMAFLPFVAESELSFYAHWGEQLDSETGASRLDTEDLGRYRRLYVPPSSVDEKWGNCSRNAKDFFGARTFTIV